MLGSHFYYKNPFSAWQIPGYNFFSLGKKRFWASLKQASALESRAIDFERTPPHSFALFNLYSPSSFKCFHLNSNFNVGFGFLVGTAG